MSTELVGGQRTWSGTIDADGHREWKVVFQTKGSLRDGPANHVQTPGLPVYGSVWVVDDDVDIWAWCRSGPTSVTPRQSKGNTFFDIEYVFSTRPPGSNGAGPSGKDDRGARKKCADARIEDPLLEPPRTSGSSIRYTEETDVDKDGKPIRYTSFEIIRGPKAEFDKHRRQVVIEQNVLNLENDLLDGMIDHLNDQPLWNLPARCWKFSDWTWQRNLYGTCNFYYTRKLVFESCLRRTYTGVTDSGWDRDILDESSKVLGGPNAKWNADGTWNPGLINGAAPDPTNMNHYINAFDRNHQPVRVILSRTKPGQPASSETDANYITVKKYPESNFLVLGIPTTL